MNNETISVTTSVETPSGGLKPYVIGFILSIVLTLSAYVFVIYEIFPPQLLIATVLAIAVVELHFQLTFFLHVYKESRPYWNLFILLMTASFILIVVFGTILIMGNLDERHSTQNSVDYLMEDDRSYR